MIGSVLEAAFGSLFLANGNRHFGDWSGFHYLRRFYSLYSHSYSRSERVFGKIENPIIEIPFPLASVTLTPLE